MPEWLDNFEHESVTDENREAFKTANQKYDTVEAAIVGGFNAQKLAGVPFKMPESMDKLPDDDSRADFTSQANKLLDITHVANIEDLADLDLKVGLAEGVEPDENLATMLKTLAVEKKWPKSFVQDIVAIWNGPLKEYGAKASAEMQEKVALEQAQKGNEALLAHYNGDEKKLAADTELLRRVFKNQAGLNAEEYESIAEELVDSKWNTHPVISKALMNLLPKFAKEGSTAGGVGFGGKGDEPQKLSPYEFKKARWPKSSSEWGKPEDTWEGQSIEMRKIAGFGKKEKKKE